MEISGEVSSGRAIYVTVLSDGRGFLCSFFFFSSEHLAKGRHEVSGRREGLDMFTQASGPAKLRQTSSTTRFHF